MENATDMQPLEISFVVAIAENGVIGHEGDLPWKLSSDLKRFKALTLGRPVVMGRKTYVSIGKPLPGRENIVITRDPGFAPEGVHVVGSIEEALALGESLARRDGGHEIAIIGGGQIYAQTLDRATVLHVTHVERALEGDTRFPHIDPAIWQSGAEEHVPEGPKDIYPTRFVTYRRRAGV